MARTHNTTRTKVEELYAEGLSSRDIADRLGLSKSTVAYHLRRIGIEADERFRRRYDWALVQAYYDEGHTVRECIAHFGFSSETWHAARRRGDIVTRSHLIPLDELLSRRRNRTHLRNRLHQAGLLADACEICGLDEWQGEPLVLHLHHLNGIGDDNRLENLQLLCPNCHSQTDNYSGRNKGRLRLVAGGADAAGDRPDESDARPEEGRDGV